MPLSDNLRTTLLLCVLIFSTSVSIKGQAGDAKDTPGSIQEEIWKEMDVPPSPILSPEEAIRSIKIADGFFLEAVATEPLVNDPVAITWDEHGRLWAAEMWAYMPDSDGKGEDEPVSRVVVMEDIDEDGIMDRSTVFLDKLVLPRALAIVKGGVLIADPPNLYFCQDLDGDLQSDRQTIVAEYAAIGNVEHAENGLMRGLDNWLYNAKSYRRLKYEDGSIEFDRTLFRGQWGITMDDWGRLFYNHNSFYLYGDLVRWEDVNNHPGWKLQAGFGFEVVPDTSVFTARVNPGVNRVYRDGKLRPDNRMINVDAVSDPEIYRGDRYPAEYHGNAFVPDPAGHVVSLFSLNDDGLEIVSEKRLQKDENWGQIEFIASTDERFRPVATAVGPDGFLYVVDMYRGIIQHKTYLTTFLRKQIIERGLDDPVGLGRIYRVVHESDSPDRKRPILAQLSPLELVPNLASENGWVRDTAQRLIVQSQTKDPAVIDALKKRADSDSERANIHALWTLEGLRAINDQTLQTAIENGSPWVKTHALRIAKPLLNKSRQSNNSLYKAYLTTLSSPEPRVRLQALQLLPQTGDPELNLNTIVKLDELALSDPLVMDACVSALYGQENEFIAKLNTEKKTQSKSEFVSNLAYASLKERNPKKAIALLQSGLSSNSNSLLAAIAAGFANATGELNARPIVLTETPPFLANLPQHYHDPIVAAFTWPGKIDPNAAAVYVYSTTEKASITRGQSLYENTCATCHQSDGLGQASLAPPLAGSEWVTGSKKRLALIVAQGLTGAIEVNGRVWNNTMPPNGMLPNLDGDNLSDLLNYIRASWGNNAEPYQPSEARNLIEPFSNRTALWTVKELEEALAQ
ncbi:Cytochrome c subfamily, putative [Verrucomicrobiia bacterium DG1235]|nr:Cytochrome c subfamily, putative [Verrucomicrobiae bacterium DG1235]